MQSQIPESLFIDLSLLQEIVESATISGESIDFFTDSGGFTINKGRIICTLDDYEGVVLEINLLNKELTLNFSNVITAGILPTSAAAAVATLAERIRDAAEEIRSIAQSKV